MSANPLSFASAALLVAALAACNKTTDAIPRTPVRLSIVSGANQTADVGAALAAPLVVQVVDGANRPVQGVAVSWTVVGGGSVAAPSASTDAQGRVSTTWTLGPTPGTQTATATSSAIAGASVSFVAGNGPTITGTVSIANANPASFYSASRVAGGVGGPRASTATRFSNRGITVTFQSGVFHVAEAGSPAYRSLAVAQSTASLLQQRVAAVTAGRPVTNVRVSPAILAAHLTVSDPDSVDAVMAALRADASVASVARDVILTVRDGAPAPQLADFSNVRLSGAPIYHPSGAATATPNDPYFSYQAWGASMTDLPKAWALETGSTAFTIAVIDMGVRFDDPDVAANLTSDGYDFVSKMTLADLGYPDSVSNRFCAGGTFPYVDDDATPGPDSDPTDPDDVYLDSTGTCWQHSSLGDHGLWTSGIIGAVGNDGRTVTGINWTARIRPIRVLGITGDGVGFDIAQGILYAAGLPAVGANGALVTAPSKSPIINLSLGGFGVDASDQAAVAAAEQAGCLIVASAGNSTTDIPVYPAAYAGVLGVSAVGMDGVIASYSDAGSYVALAAPGGEFRLDDNGGDGVLGPGWDFTKGQPTLVFGYGTSASAPFVSGIAALLLAHEPGLTAAAISTRLETYATRAPNTGRNDNYGWGIVNAYNALTSQTGAPRQAYVRLLDATTGAVVRTVAANGSGQFSFTQLAPGSYQIQAGEDESGDAAIGIPGRRFAWVGGATAPTVFSTAAGSALVQTTGVAIGMPGESEPNDAVATANPLSVGGYVTGTITAPDVADYYKVLIPAPGTYTFETSGFTGACGWGLELDTQISLLNAAGTVLASNDDNNKASGPNCSTITTTLTAGTYYVDVLVSEANGLTDHGRYRLQVRAGT